MSNAKIIGILLKLRRAGTESEKKDILSNAVTELRAIGLSNDEIIGLFRRASILDKGFDTITKYETIDTWKSNEDDYLALLKEILREPK